jgi:hypothetical protein
MKSPSGCFSFYSSLAANLPWLLDETLGRRLRQFCFFWKSFLSLIREFQRAPSLCPGWGETAEKLESPWLWGRFQGLLVTPNLKAGSLSKSYLLGYGFLSPNGGNIYSRTWEFGWRLFCSASLVWPILEMYLYLGSRWWTENCFGFTGLFVSPVGLKSQ